jgi:CheY-like chemotaxis protein
MKKDIKIVIVDDDIDDHFIIKDAIRYEIPNAEILSFYDGQNAVDYLLQKGKHKSEFYRQPHLVLLDINMPRKDGFETLSELKNSPLSGVLIMIMTTSTDKGDMEKADRLGADGFYTKPNTLLNFRTMIREIISKVNY